VIIAAADDFRYFSPLFRRHADSAYCRYAASAAAADAAIARRLLPPFTPTFSLMV
jgi:hypothetical protein